MRLLIAHASKHGATAGIAARIAETLTASGHDDGVATAGVRLGEVLAAAAAR